MFNRRFIPFIVIAILTFMCTSPPPKKEFKTSNSYDELVVFSLNHGESLNHQS